MYRSNVARRIETMAGLAVVEVYSSMWSIVLLGLRRGAHPAPTPQRATGAGFSPHTFTGCALRARSAMNRLLTFLLLAALPLVLGACDSDPKVPGAEVDGRYQATQYTFVQEGGTLIGTVDVLSYMAVASGERVFSAELFGQDLDYVIAFQLASESSRSSIRGSFSSESSNRIQLDLGNDPDGPRILLPSPLTLATSADSNTLTASAVTTVTFEQLARLDPVRFGGLSGGNIRGRLTLKLERQ